VHVWLSAAGEKGGNNLQDFQGLRNKNGSSKARIWPSLANLFQVRSPRPSRLKIAVEIFDACQRRGFRVLDPESHNRGTGFGVHGTGCAVCYGQRGVEDRRRSKIAVEIFDACANLI